MSNMPVYKIRIKEGTFEIELQGDKEWVERKIKEFIAEKKLKTTRLLEAPSESIPETLGEFLDVKGNPRKHTDIVAVFAYWLLKKKGLRLFNVKDIIECYKITRIAKPKNPNQIINANVRRHIFAEADEKKDGLKAWVLTRTGEAYVEQMGRSG